MPVVAPSNTTSDLNSEKMQVEVAQVVEVEVEDVAIDDLVPSSTPIPAAVVEVEADVAVAPTPVPTPATTTVPATVPATVRFGSAVQEAAPSGFPVASGTNRGVSGLFPPSGNKSPFGSSFVTLAAGAGVGAGAATMPIATNNLSFLSTPSSTSAPASSGVQGFGGVASSLSAPFTFGSAAKKGSTFGSQLSMGFATQASTSASTSNIAEALPPSASENDAMVLQMHSEDSMGYNTRDMAEGEREREGGEIEDDFEGTQSYFEDEHSHSQSSTFTQPMGSSFTPAPLSVPVSSSFGFSNPSSDAQKPSIFGSKTGFGSSVPSSSAGSSFVAAAPFFLLSQSSASPRIGGIPASVTGSANPFAIAPSLGFPASTPIPDAALALVPVSTPALSITSTPFSSPVPAVELSAPTGVPVVISSEVAVPSSDSSLAATSATLPTATPTPASTPVATTPVVSVPAPAPARQPAGRKLKPKPAHLVAAIPAFAQVINIPDPNMMDV